MSIAMSFLCSADYFLRQLTRRHEDTSARLAPDYIRALSFGAHHAHPHRIALAPAPQERSAASSRHAEPGVLARHGSAPSEQEKALREERSALKAAQAERRAKAMLPKAKPVKVVKEAKPAKAPKAPKAAKPPKEKGGEERQQAVARRQADQEGREPGSGEEGRSQVGQDLTVESASGSE
jgi:hypothetical protein